MIREALKSDIPKILEMIKISMEKMKEEGNYQWPAGYPDKLLLKLGYQQKNEFERDDCSEHFIYFEKEIGCDLYEL